jgi:hypothetical protein
LGEFSPNGRSFSLGGYIEISEVAQNLVLLSYEVQKMY